MSRSNAIRMSWSNELLVDMMALPDGSEIIGARMGENYNGAVEFLVSNPSFPSVKLGAKFPEPNVTFHADLDNRPTTRLTMEIDFDTEQKS